MNYHKNAKTNIFVRKQIARRISDSEEVAKVAREFGITRKTAYTWAAREDFRDRSSRPKK
jgi:transposase-like protein